MSRAYWCPTRVRNTFFCVLVLLLATAAAHAQAPTFGKIFAPETIGPGSTSTLTFTITNVDQLNPISDIAFTDALPSGVTIATPAHVTNTCGGSVNALDGAGTIVFSGGILGANSTCAITVDVTSSTVGVHTNTTGDLTSSAGNSGTATDDLTVASNRPGFTKSFAPGSVPVGSRSTLTFTIDNSLNASALSTLVFVDNFPTGLEIADPANSSTTCGGITVTLTAIPGTDTLSFSAFGFPSPGLEVLIAGSSCTVSVDVIATGAGVLDNVTSDLTSDLGSSGKASASLDVTRTDLALIKSFTDDPTPPGGIVNLEFTIDNFDRNFSATGIAFTDDLGAALTGLAAIGLPTPACGGTLSGTTALTLTGGSLGPAGSCTFSVGLSVPPGAAPGVYTNTTGTISATVDGAPVTGNVASDDLFVEPVPLLTKEFRDAQTDAPDPVINAGDDVVIRFTIANTSTTSGATDIAFIDELTTFLPYPVSVVLPATPCGAGSSIALVSLDVDREGLSLTGGTLAAAPGAGSSCTFDVTLTVPVGVGPGTYVNTTEVITATVDGATRVGAPAYDDFTVIAAPGLSKAFADDPVAPGGTVTLEFTLTHSPDATGDATDISFTDDLVPVLAGLTATLPPNPDPPCGVGSSLTGASGNTLLTLMGGTLGPGESCNFSVTLNVPAGAASGSYPNTTSGVTATVEALTATSAPASDDLTVAGLTFTKEFVDDPVIPGETVTLRFTLENVGSTPADDATDISFTDNLADVLPGTPDLTVVGTLPTTPCGPGSAIAGTTFLTFTGGELSTGEICTFDVTLQVPAGAPDGAYVNTTSNLSASIDNTPTVLDPATDLLTINSDLLALTKEFTDDPVAPGDTVNLRFTLTNLDSGQAASAIAFSDDLGAVLPGLAATGLPTPACNGTVSGTGTVSLAGGSLGPGAQCQFDVSVTVPAGAAANSYTNTTSDVTGTIGGLPVSGNAATDNLEVSNLLLFSKSFDGPTTATGTPVLTFTITNPGTSAAADVSFSDDLDAVIMGLVATNLPLSNVCGQGSQLTGTSFLSLAGGSIPPNGGVCSFDVDLLVPGTAAAGAYSNTTSGLFQGGLPVATPATADLAVEPPPTFVKNFAPNVIGLGLVSTLTFTIDNFASAVVASALDFLDILPAGVVVATPPNATSTCSGGTLTANAGGGVVGFTGGSVGAATSCTVQVDVAGMTLGAHLNTTGDLTSSSGNSGPATDILTVNPQPPGFSKVFAPNSINVGGTSTLSFTIDNTGGTVDATNLDFTDNLPAFVFVATPASASTTCTGGTLTAISGSGVITYTGGAVGAGTSCTVQVDVTSGTAGTHVNTTGDLSSSLGSSGSATANLDVGDVDFTLTKIFTVDPVLRGGSMDLEFTLTNEASSLDLTDIAFTDDLDAALSGLVAVGLPANDVCGSGSLFDGTSVLSLTGASLAPGASCTFSATLTVPGAAPLGTYTNTTSTVTAQAPGSPASAPPATGDFEVVFLPFDKVFNGDGTPGGTVLLTFTLSNPDPFNTADNISFTDDLDAVLPGLMAEGLPMFDICGPGSQLDGTSIINLTSGILGPLESCIFNVTLGIPSTAASGDYTNTTSILEATVGGTTVTGDPAAVATDDLTVVQRYVIPTLSTLGVLIFFGLAACVGYRKLRIGG